MGCYSVITARSQALIRRCETRDPFRIARALGIEVLFVDSLRQLKGMYRVIKRNRFILLNRDNSERMNRIVCAHELGHDQLHRRSAVDQALKEFVLYDMTTQQEYEANLFAAELLLDDAEMLSFIRRGFDTVQIADATGTDINLVALKADGLIRVGYPLRGQEHDSRFLK